ncbi:MAG TPA: dihydroorotate dehydrogenase-like protein [Kiritimatiellia bacterium]|nr:dihydroorotate dehydrogenase-like protein [Kiritimatiellia bacterium]
MDLRTTYMGLELKNPLVASASPLSETPEKIKRLEDAGVSAVVMFSIFEEQLRQEAAVMDYALHAGSDSFAESLSYFPQRDDYSVKPDRYLQVIEKAAAACEIPVIGSLNGITNEGWINYAKQIEQAGAKGLELNIYWTPTDPALSASDVEKRYIDIVSAVKAAVKVPVAVKLSPFFSSFANFAGQVDKAGADALVLFNRFYQPDFDIEEREVKPQLNLSTPYEIRLPLLWIAILHGRVKCSLGATRGVHSAIEIVKYVMAGADAVMTTSALLQYGVAHVGNLLWDLRNWMEVHEFDSIKQMKGCMSQRHVADPSAFERANYIKTLESYKAVLRDTA